MRLLVVAFLAIATAISVNAIYFQDAQRVAASGVNSGFPKAEKRVAAKASAQHLPSGVTAALPAKSTPPPATKAEPQTAAIPPIADAHRASVPKPAESTPLVRSIQAKLARFGYKSMPRDGLPSPETRAAILAVEYEQGHPLTGEPTEPVLAALYFFEASGKTRLAAIEGAEQDRKLIREVQDLLAKLGYTSGPLDGQLDAKTRDAIKRFEADRRLKAAGRLTDRVLLEMVIERGKPFLSKG